MTEIFPTFSIFHIFVHTISPISNFFLPTTYYLLPTTLLYFILLSPIPFYFIQLSKFHFPVSSFRVPFPKFPIS